MPRVLKIGAAVVMLVCLFIGAVVFSVFRATSGLVETSDAFFGHAAEGDFDRALELLAEEFRAATSEEGLREFLSRSALTDYASASWGARSVDTGGQGRLEGRVLTKSGGRIPVTLSFVQERGQWKIYSIHKPSAGIVADSGRDPAPSEADVSRLISATTAAFARGFGQGSLRELWEGAAPEFREQVKLEQLEAGFRPFLRSGIDLDQVGFRDIAPVIRSGPTVEDNGVMRVTGHFPGRHVHLLFDYKYVYRFSDWKLLGFKLETVLTEVETLRARARTLHENGDHDQALVVAKQALVAAEEAVAEKAVGEMILRDLAWFYHVRGRDAEAEPLMRRALAIRETIYGPEHPGVAHALHGLATIQQSQGEYREAETLLERTLAIREKSLGADHADVARVLDDMAALYARTERPKEAEGMSRRAAAIRAVAR